MKALVVGAAGYLGKNLSHYLMEMGHEVTGIARSAVSDTLFDHPRWQGVVLDASRFDQLTCLNLVDYDVIYVMAGKTGTLDGFERYEEYISCNQLPLLHILKLVVDQGSNARIVFPSSRLVYQGKPGIKLKEDDEKTSRTVYAVNKLACEGFLEAWSRLRKVEYTIFRLCVPYGHLTGTGYGYGTLSFMMNQASKDGRIKLFGDGQMRRTFTHVRDVCRVMMLYPLRSDTKNMIINIGGGDHCSLLELASMIATKQSCSVEFSPWPEDHLLVESGDTMFDDGLLQSIMPFAYRGRLEDILGEA